jgi:hypothetical protein
MFLRNLNVFVPCWAVLGLFLAAPVAAMVSTALNAAHVSNPVGKAMLVAYALVAAVPALVWRFFGLVPAALRPDRQRRFARGQVVLSVANLAAVAAVSGLYLPWLRSQSLLWIGVYGAVSVVPLLAWPAGLAMVWTSGGGVAPELSAGHAIEPPRAASLPPRAAAEGTFLRNLNVFIAAAALGLALATPLVLMVSLPLTVHLGMAGLVLQGLGWTAVPLLLLRTWWTTGLSPATRRADREERFLGGHRLLLLATMVMVLMSAATLLVNFAPDAEAARLVLYWLTAPVEAFVGIAWALGLFMVWSARAPIVPIAPAGAALHGVR